MIRNVSPFFGVEIREALLDWFPLEQFVPILILAFLLAFVGGQIAPEGREAQRRARWLSVAAFLLYAGIGVHEWGIEDATEAVQIAIRALLFCAVTYGMGSILFSIVVHLQNQLNAMKLRRDTAKRNKRPPSEKPEVTVERLPDPPSPPPPTRDELAAKALKKYEERLSVIDNSKLDEIAAKAARQHAQQQYTRDLDKVMQ